MVQLRHVFIAHGCSWPKHRLPLACAVCGWQACLGEGTCWVGVSHMHGSVPLCLATALTCPPPAVRNPQAQKTIEAVSLEVGRWQSNAESQERRHKEVRPPGAAPVGSACCYVWCIPPPRFPSALVRHWFVSYVLTAPLWHCSTPW